MRRLRTAGIVLAAMAGCHAASDDGSTGAQDVVASDGGSGAQDDAAKLGKINHFVVIYLENHSFDNLYGQFEGAEGLANAKPENRIQVDEKAVPYDKLPPGAD